MSGLDVEDDSPIAALSRIALALDSPEDLHWLRQCLQTYITGEGALRMEQCFKIKAGSAAWRKRARKHWIGMAMREVRRDGEPLWTACGRLATQWEAFLARGPWLVWKGLSSPPPDCQSRLHTALFHVARLSDGGALGQRQLHNIMTEIESG